MTTTLLSTTDQSPTATKVGWVITALASLFFAFDGVTHIIKTDPVVEAMDDLGFPLSQSPTIGMILLACTLLYLVPRTNLLGAVLLTSYLGGALAIQLRIEAPLSALLFPVYFGILVWAGLWLRDARVRAVKPLRRDLGRASHV